MTRTFIRQELALSIAAELRGSITFAVLAAALKDCDPRIASRVLQNLESSGALRRFRVVGSHSSDVWLTTQAAGQGEKAGIKAFTTQGSLCMPPKEWWHDQLAARFAFTLADDVDAVLLEHELRRWDKTGLPRLPDGVFRHTCQGNCDYTAMEVETSRKTGLNGGWARLAIAMIDRANGCGEFVSAWDKRINFTVVAATWKYMKAIRATIRRTLERRWKQERTGEVPVLVLDRACWLWVDLDEPNSSPRLMTAMNESARGSNWLGYHALQRGRAKDPARCARALRTYSERKAPMLRTTMEDRGTH